MDVTSARMFLALAMVSVASFYDIKKREVHDLIWIIFVIPAAILIFFEPNLFDALKSIGFAMILAPIAILLWRFGFFGAADALCLISLVFIAPLKTFSEFAVTPLTPLTNAAIISIIPVMVNFFRNALSCLRSEEIFKDFQETKFKKMLAMFLGYRAKNPKYGFSIEVQENSVKKFDFSLKNADYTEYCTKPNTWISPGIPYICYIAAGFVVQLFAGDILAHIFNLKS